MKALVTGATGFLGGHLAELLIRRGFGVRALIRPAEDGARLESLGVEICRGDLRDPASLQAAVDGAARVFHCAARTGPWGREADYQKDNVEGLRLLLAAATGAGVERFVHVSSITVHGNDVGGKADESTPFRIEPNPYSRSKVAAELFLGEMIRRGAPVTIVRPGWIYGPGDAASFGPLAARIRGGHMVQIGPGHNHLPLVFVGDVAEGMIQAAESHKAAGRAYLLVSPEPVTQRQYLAAIAAELGVAPPSLRVPYRAGLALGAMAECAGHALRRASAPPLTRYGVQMLGGDNQFIVARACWDFGFSAQTSMLDGVRQSVAWYQALHNTRPTLKEDFEHVGTRHWSNWPAGQASHPSPAGAGPERQRAGAAR